METGAEKFLYETTRLAGLNAFLLRKMRLFWPLVAPTPLLINAVTKYVPSLSIELSTTGAEVVLTVPETVLLAIVLEDVVVTQIFQK